MLPEKFADIDLSESNPISAILESPECQRMVQVFADSPAIKNALVSPDSQALLYSLIRILRPATAVEIGTYKASTTEAMARAIADNRFGKLHTVDPFGAATVPNIIRRWPRELQAVTNVHLVDSMLFFAEMQKNGERADLVFVDGNHDYEFALFDIQCAARLLNPGGFLVIDNIAQPGPFFAAQDFMRRGAVQGWAECGSSLNRYRQGEMFDIHRTTTHNTDFCILRAPQSISISDRPVTFGDMPWEADNSVLHMKLVNKAPGKLFAQFIMRIFENPPREVTHSVTVDTSYDTELDVPIDFPSSSDRNARRTVETWMTWEGEGDLRLSEFPSIRAARKAR